MSGLRERLAALVDRWEEQYADHTKAGAVAESQMMAALQVASGSVRHLCAGEIRALLAEDETPVVTYECCGAPVGDVVRMDHRCAPATPDDVEFIKRLIDAWDCCGTCAGGVLAERDRKIRREGADAALAPVEAVLPTGPRPFVDLHSIGRWDLAEEVRNAIEQGRDAAEGGAS